MGVGGSEVCVYLWRLPLSTFSYNYKTFQLLYIIIYILCTADTSISIIEFDRYPVWYRYQVPVLGICMKKIGMNPVSVQYGGYLGYRYRYQFGKRDFGHIGISISVWYRFFNAISVSYISVSYRHIGIISIYRYRFGMGDFGYIGFITIF